METLTALNRLREGLSLKTRPFSMGAQSQRPREDGATMIAHLRGREKALEPFGWTGRRAEWIAVACLHSGVFTRAQWTRFLGCHTEKVRRALHALIAQGMAAEENPPGISGIGRVCRIYGRGIYRVLGAGDIRRRRIASTEVLMRRLLSLDYVLEHPRLPWLPTVADALEAPWGIHQERRLREVFVPDQVTPGEMTRKIAEVVRELGLQPWKPPEPLDPIEEEEVNLVVWMGVMKTDASNHFKVLRSL